MAKDYGKIAIDIADQATTKITNKATSLPPDLMEPLANHQEKRDLVAAQGTCWKVSRIRKAFNSGKEAIDYINNNSFLGESFPRLSPKLGNIMYINKDESEIEASIILTWQLDCSKSKIKMIIVYWNKMSEKEKNAVDNFHRDLLNHEEGHMTVAKNVAQKRSTTVTAVGFDRNDALSKLQRELNKQKEETNSLLQEEAGDGGNYDKVTDHGRKQSLGPTKGYPGGNDINLLLE